MNKFVSVMTLSIGLALLAGCNKTEAPAGPAAAGSGAATVKGGTTSGVATTAAAPAAGDSFFAGDLPAGVKLKPNKTFAIDPGILNIQSVDGWNGGQLPGYDYLGVSKDSSGVVRVASATGANGDVQCKDLATPAAMAPLKAKNLQEKSPVVLRPVGKNKFLAREGVCTADGAKGPLEIHFLDISRTTSEGNWHYAVLAAFPANASPEVRNEVMAWGRNLEFTGKNGFKAP
jgi:hypothetical protein